MHSLKTFLLIATIIIGGACVVGLCKANNGGHVKVQEPASWEKTRWVWDTEGK